MSVFSCPNCFKQRDNKPISNNRPVAVFNLDTGLYSFLPSGKFLVVYNSNNTLFYDFSELAANPTQIMGRAAEQPVMGVTVVKPIVYGNIAKYFGEKRKEDGHTHQWTVYVKPYNNEDMSTYVKKVHMKLHESYANPNRIVSDPPYEITETGWGEFEIVIKIYFHDPNERPVTLYHILKLFQSAADINLGRKTLVSESYEEVVFQEPTSYMHHLLTNTRQLTLGPWKHDTNFEEKKKQTLTNIIAAENKIRPEIAELRERLKLAEETISKFKAEIAASTSNASTT